MAAINKRKLLESAQRNLQKGAVDKALKDYQTILEADPRDANVRLKIGDLQLKANKNDEAITCYLKVADQFMRDGFDAKAVAIYKQITKIDSKRQDIYVPLADLYQRLGLVSEAMAALQTAADSYHRDGRKREALDLLRRMASLDPSNTTSRLKVAQLLQQEGLTDEALAEYREAASELERQGDWEARVSVLQRILELRADDIDALAALGELLADHNQAKRAEGFARRLVAADETRAESHELLARILTDLGQQERAVESHRHAAEAWRQRGEEDRARAILQRYVPAEPFAPDSDPGAGESPFESAGLGGEPFALDHDEFPVAGDHLDAGRAEETPPEPEAEPPPLPPLPPRAPATLPELEPRPALQKSAPKPKPAAPVAKAPAAPAKPAPAPPKPAATPARPAAPLAKPAPAQAKPAAAAAKPAAEPKPAAAKAAAPSLGDLDQLLAEAGVYLRYGKHERAIASLDSVLASDAEHPVALEQMGEVLAATGDNERAVETWLRAAASARARGEGERFDGIVRRIAAVDAVAAASVAPEPAAPPRARATAAPTVLFDAGGAPAEESDADAPDEAAEGGFDDIEIDVDAEGFLDEASDDSDAAAEEPEAAEPAPAPETEDDAQGAAEGADIEIDARESEDDEDEPAPPESEAAEPLEAEEGEAPDASAGEIDVEDFELDDEAEPPVEEPEERVSAAPDAWELPPEPDEEMTPAEPEVAPQATPAPSELSSTTTQQILEEFEEAGFYFEQGLYDEAESIYRRILVRAPNHPGALLRLGEIAVQRGRDPGEGVGDIEPDSTDSTEQALAAKAAKPPRGAAAEAKAAPQPAAEGAEIEPPDETDLTDRHMDVGEAAWLREGGESDPGAAPSPVTPDQVGAAASPPQPAPSASAPQPVAPAPPAAAAASAPEPAREEPELTTPEVAQEGDPSGAAFDLAAELSEALATPAAARAATDEDGFESVFREFKRGVSQTLGEGDAETHFDLGIAYREMGLFDDAIGEFRYALGTPARRLDALHMMGLCALDLSRPHDAVGHFEQALASPEVPAEREVPLRFDLGRAYQAQSDRVRALGAFRRVVELDATFQDAAQRIEALESDAGSAAPPAQAREAYESFDDLIAESADDAPAPAPPAPSYENFEDVMAEVGDDDARAGAPVESDEVAAEEREPEPAAADAPEKSDPADSVKPEPSPTAPRRRRKVSFV